MAHSDIAWIDEPLEAERADTLDRLGGKGTALAEMAQHLDLPVPPAFVITTAACRSYMNHGWPDGLEARITTAMDELGRRVDRRFGDPERPVLVAIRSGAPVSMPGMMDTVLNVGINPDVRDALARETSRPEFAAQTWLRFCRMYAETVLEMDRDVVDGAVGDPTDETGYNEAADRLRLAAEPEGGIPLDPQAQVRGAVEAVFRSWNSARALLFREAEGIDDHLGTAVVVQAMVFGNLDEHSGTGVVFTRDPGNGADEPYGDYLARAQGEDVVAGTHEVHGLDALHQDLPEVYEELLAVCHRLEHHYRDMCDIEFTVAAGRLYILQTRVGRRSPEATVRIAAQMAADPDFPLTKAEAVERIDHETLEGISTLATVAEGAVPFASGIAASPGVGFGVLSTDPDEAADVAAAGTHVVLARAETSPSDVHGMVGAAGLITSLGGSVSHAAVVARSWGIPAVTGAREIEVEHRGIRVGDRFIESGTLVTVDGTGGRVFVGDQLADHDHDVPELDQLRQWAVELGLELGEHLGSEEEPEAAHRDIGRFEVMRALQLKGIGSIDALAHALDTDLAAVEAIVEDLGEFVLSTPRGMAVAPPGREWVEAELASERSSVDDEVIAAAYDRFLPLNRGFKELVTHWQTSPQAEADLARVTGALQELHGSFRPIVSETIDIVARLAPYLPRFEHSLEAVAGGDVSVIASPLKDSYHTVWFEYHEELIHLIGRTRLEEEQDEAGH